MATSPSENAISSISEDIPESQQFHNQSDGKGSPRSSGEKNYLNKSVDESDEDVIETASPRLSVQFSDTESYSGETGVVKDEWEDWSDKGDYSNDLTKMGGNSIDQVQKEEDSLGWNDNGDNSIESDISDEIEKELQNMSVESDSYSAKSGGKSPLHSNKKTSKNALKLFPKKSKPVAVDKQEVDHDAVISEIEKSVQDKSSSYDRSAFASSKTAHSDGKVKDLGSEFDIKNIDIKVQPVAEDPFDFFADMAPKIESKNVSDVLKEAGRSLDEPVVDTAMSKVSFEVKGSVIEDTGDGGGWGDDDDW